MICSLVSLMLCIYTVYPSLDKTLIIDVSIIPVSILRLRPKVEYFARATVAELRHVHTPPYSSKEILAREL